MQLAFLLDIIDARMAIEPAIAAAVVQDAAVAGEIRAEVIGWPDDPLCIYDGYDWVSFPDGSTQGPAEVSELGWRHVDWSAGTLRRCTIQLWWEDVKNVLEPLIGEFARSQAAKKRRAQPAQVSQPGDANPLALVPPDWVHLPEIEAWLTRRFGVPAADVIPDLITSLRAGRVRHRVADCRLNDLEHSGYGSVIDPPGLGWSNRQVVYVMDWEAAQIDWPSGTVNGRRLKGEKRERLKVQLYWLDVERWAESPLRDLKEKIELEARRKAEVAELDRPSPVPEGKLTTGRPLKHDWDAFWIEVALWLDLNGSDGKHRPDLQSHLEKWTARESLSPPDAATIRKKLMALYKAAAARK